MKYDEIKSLTFWGIPFMTICGGIYHVAFWDTFGINGLSYINLVEIIQSFIYPFFSAIIIFGLGVLLSAAHSPSDQVKDKTLTITKFDLVLNSKWFNNIIGFVWIILIYFGYKYGSINKWFVWGFICGVVPYVYFLKNGMFVDQIQNTKIRNILIAILVFLPSYCFAMGKYNAENIKQNIKYDYVTKIKSEYEISTVDTLKLIGYAGHTYFFTNLKNDFNLVLQSDKIDYLEIKNSK